MVAGSDADTDPDADAHAPADTYSHPRSDP
jgi:hypothetical protein